MTAPAGDAAEGAAGDAAERVPTGDAAEGPAGDPAERVPTGDAAEGPAGDAAERVPAGDAAERPAGDAAEGAAAPAHRFGQSAPFTVGLEEELLLVDRDTLSLAHVADRVLERVELPPERVDHEAFLAEIEVRSEPSGSVHEAIAQVFEGRRAVLGTGATIMSTGLHPDAVLFDAELVASERYQRVERQMRGLIKRTPECALHVHVGVPDPEAAVAAMNGLREALPLLHGLGANSPFWFGSDSGMASSRAAVIRAYPGRGIPPAFRSWDEYLEALDAVRAGGGPTDRTMVWWDARPQPRLGTVELREVDAQTSLDSAGAIAALARALVRRAVEAPPREPAPEQALHWSSFRAARDGLDAEIYQGGRPVPLRVAAGLVLAGLGREDPELEQVERIVREGNGADRQREMHERGGMPGLLRYLAEATAWPMR